MEYKLTDKDLERELHDDSTSFGGIEYPGEKVEDFIFYCEKKPKTLGELNAMLISCGILPIQR